MRHILAGVAIAIFGLCLTFALRLGAFRTVNLTIATIGPMKTVYKDHLGAYHQIVSVLDEVEAWAKKNEEPCKQTYGEYLDDVDRVSEDRLHSRGGCLVDKDWSLGFLAEGLHYSVIPARRYVRADFDGAPSIGPLKVYPKARKFIAAQGFSPDGDAVIEIYEVLPGQRVHTEYLFPVK